MDTVDDLLGTEETVETVDSLLEPTTTETLLGTIPKAAYALNKGIESGVADLGAGIARLSDPGPLRNNRATHTRAMIRAGETFGYDPEPVDPLTLQPVGRLDPLTRAMARLRGEQEQRRFQLRLPGESLEQAARKEAEEFAALEERTPGSKTIAKGAEAVGGMLPVVAEAAVPFVGPAAAVVTGGAQTTGAVYNQAVDYYRKLGLDEETAMKLADEAALKAGAENAALFTALPGPANKLAGRILGDRLAARPIAQALARTGLSGVQAGTVMAADTVLRNVDAAKTYRPDLTAGETVEEAAKSFGAGFVAGTMMHAPQEFAKVKGKNRDAEDLESEIGDGTTAAAGPEIIPPSRQLRNRPIITPPPGGPDLAAIESMLRDLPTLPPVERLTPAERRQALNTAMSERQPIDAALVDRINQDLEVPLAMPEGYALQGGQYVFTEPSKRLTPTQRMVRENQEAMDRLRESRENSPAPVVDEPTTTRAATSTTAEPTVPREPLVPVEVKASDIKAAKTRMSKRSPGDEKRMIAEDEARREVFEGVAFKEGRPESDPVELPHLFVGDTFTLNGRRVHVRDWVIDADTGKPAGVNLTGAYGDQFVPAGKTLHVDRDTLKLHQPDILDRADAALKARQDEIRKEGRLGFLGDPELGGLAIARGAVKIAQGARDFAKWSAEMIKEFGEAIQPQLQKIWDEAQRVVKGEHPTIGLSERGIKLTGDEGLAGSVRDAINPLYTKRTNESDTDLARRIITSSGGPASSAQAWLNGQFRDAPGSVQTILASQIQRDLANYERSMRSQGKTAEADATVQQQIKLAQADIARATDTAQALQAFQAHYANWTPAAWLMNFRKNVTRVAADRVGKATGREVPADPVEISQTIARDVADTVKADQPKLGKILEEQYGGGSGEPKPLEERLRQNGTPEAKVKATAKKIESFFEKEVRKWRKKNSIPEFDQATERDIVQRANALEKLPADSVQRRAAAQDLFTHLQKLKGFEWWELPLDFWYANILSGATTHAKNILGNAVNLGAETAVQMIRQPTAIPQILEALGRAMPKSGREGLNIIRTGKDTGGRHGDKFESGGVLERVDNPVASKLLLPWKLVGRFLKAEDVGFFYPLQEVKGVALARRQAAAEGFPILGGKRAARARSILAWTAEARSKAQAQATREGLTGMQHSRRVGELLEQARPPELMENARDFAFLGTFNNDPYGILGALTNAWGSAAERIPALKLVVPFTRIVANLSNSMLNWTPVGYWRGARAQGHKLLIGRPDNTGKLFGKAVTDPTAIGDLYARSTIGSIALGAIAIAAGKNIYDQDPDFMVTGQGPKDPNQRAILQQAGWIPYSVKIGSRYYSYQDKPLALPMSIVGHYLDAVRYRKLDQQDAINRSAYAIGAAGNVILNSSWLQGLSSLFNTANRDSTQSPLQGLPRQAMKTASSFVVPNALRQVDQLFDDTKYTADDIRGMMMRETPFARRENQPDLNVFGQPIHQPLSKLFFSKVEGDKLTQTLAGRRLWPSVPVEGELTPAEQYQLMKFRGPLLKAALIERLAEIQTLPHSDAQDLVTSISRRVTADAKKTLGLDQVNRLREEMRDTRER